MSVYLFGSIIAIAVAAADEYHNKTEHTILQWIGVVALSWFHVVFSLFSLLFEIRDK